VIEVGASVHYRVLGDVEALLGVGYVR